MFLKRFNNKGQGLTGAIIASGLAGILVLTYISLNKMQTRYKNKVRLTNTAQNLRYLLIATLRNEDGFDKIRTATGNGITFNCIANDVSPCCEYLPPSVPGQPDNYFVENCKPLSAEITIPDFLDLFNRGGTNLNFAKKTKWLSYGQTALNTDGFSESGQPCNTFNYISGSDECPFRYEVRVESRCSLAASTCLNPHIKYIARLKFLPDKNGFKYTTNEFKASDYDFELFRSGSGAAASAQAKIATFNVKDPAVSETQFWNAQSSRRLLVELWGGGGGGAGGHFYAFNERMDEMYEYTEDFYDKKIAGLNYVKDDRLGRKPWHDVLQYHYFAGGGGAGGGYASMTIKVPRGEAGVFDQGTYYKIHVGKGGNPGGFNTDGGAGGASYVQGPYRCTQATAAECDTSNPDHFEVVEEADQFVIAFGGKPGSNCGLTKSNGDVHNEITKRCLPNYKDRSTSQQGRGGSSITNFGDFIPATGVHAIPTEYPEGYDPNGKDAQIAKGGDGDPGHNDGFNSGQLLNVIAGAPGGDMEQTHTSFFDPGEMEGIGPDEIQHIEFSNLPNTGQVAFQWEYKNKIYKHTPTTLDDTDEWQSMRQVWDLGEDPPELDNSNSEIWVETNNGNHDWWNTQFDKHINDMSYGGVQIQHTPGWNCGDSKCIDADDLYVGAGNEVPSGSPFIYGGYKVRFKGEFKTYNVHLIKVLDYLETAQEEDCSADFGGKQCKIYTTYAGSLDDPKNFNNLAKRIEGTPGVFEFNYGQTPVGTYSGNISDTQKVADQALKVKLAIDDVISPLEAFRVDTDDLKDKIDSVLTTMSSAVASASTTYSSALSASTNNADDQAALTAAQTLQNTASTFTALAAETQTLIDDYKAAKDILELKYLDGNLTSEVDSVKSATVAMCANPAVSDKDPLCSNTNNSQSAINHVYDALNEIYVTNSIKAEDLYDKAVLVKTALDNFGSKLALIANNVQAVANEDADADTMVETSALSAANNLQTDLSSELSSISGFDDDFNSFYGKLYNDSDDWQPIVTTYKAMADAANQDAQDANDAGTLDLAGYDGMVMAVWDPIDLEWDCVRTDIRDGDVDRRSRDGSVFTDSSWPNSAVSSPIESVNGSVMCNGNKKTIIDSNGSQAFIRFSNQSGADYDYKYKNLSSLTAPGALDCFFKGGCSSGAFDSAYMSFDWGSSSTSKITYKENQKVPCPKFYVYEDNGGTPSWVEKTANGASDQVPVTMTCDEGRDLEFEYTKIRVREETPGGADALTYNKKNDYMVFYYLGGRGGRAAKGGTGGSNDLDNLGTKPTIPGGGGAGKMLDGCYIEQGFNDVDPGGTIVDKEDWSTYGCDTSATPFHVRDKNDAMRGAPGRVLIYY